MNKENEPIEPKVKYVFGPDIDLDKEVVLELPTSKKVRNIMLDPNFKLLFDEKK